MSCIIPPRDSSPERSSEIGCAIVTFVFVFAVVVAALAIFSQPTPTP